MILFDNVSKIYSRGTFALRDINLKINNGEFISIVGQSGAGKTTLLKILTLEEKPSRGKIFLSGQDIALLPPRKFPYFRRKIGVVFQDYKLLAQKTVFENIAFAMEVAGFEPKEIIKDVPQILEMVGLGDKERNFPHELSGGEKQRISLARALVNGPEILLADEPTGNLDLINTKDILSLLLKINKLGTTVILATHNKDIVNILNRRVVTLDKGRIALDQGKREVYDLKNNYAGKLIESKIKEYIKNLPPNVLPIKTFSDITIEKIKGGDYNLNFRVGLDNHNFLMRFNIESQSGLENQIEYEYKTLEFLVPYKIAPIPYHLDNTQNFFPYGLLIEQYINGNKLVFSIDAIKRAAKTLAKLHTIPLNGKEFFMRWENPLRKQFDIVCNSLAQYKTKKMANKKLVLLGEKIIKSMKIKLSDIEKDFEPKSFIHTDVVPSNFVDTGSEIYLIDWEKGRIDDPSYDLAMFFFKLANLWDSPRVLTENEKKAFMKIYIMETGDASIQKRINDRLVLITLQSILWAGGRIIDVEEETIDKMLGKQNYERYKKAFQLNELEKIVNDL